MDKRKIFEYFTKDFETDLIRDYLLDMSEHMPDYIFTIPSSTSMKYHNAQQCQTYGQLYHEYMFMVIVDHRLRLKHNKELYSSPEVRDCMRATAYLHDAVKCGWNGSRYTVQDHPMLAAQWVRDTKVEHDIPDELKEMIAGLCEAHSGEWNKSRSGVEIMPEPRNEMEFFIHECDILSSRSDIEMNLPDELVELVSGCVDVKSALPDINEFILTFGKHKGKTLPEVQAVDPGWISWAKENLDREPVKSLLKEL